VADPDTDLNNRSTESDLPDAAPGRRRSARPLHFTPAAMALVLAGGFVGAAAREAVEQALHSSSGGFPWATFLINLAGAFILGLLLEALVRAGQDSGWRRGARLLGGTGVCGGFTTYSTFALEAVQLGRAGHVAIAALYVAATVIGGLITTTAGIAVASAPAGRRRHAALPIDPDLDREAPR
jgi:CrcB protein